MMIVQKKYVLKGKHIDLLNDFITQLCYAYGNGLCPDEKIVNLLSKHSIYRNLSSLLLAKSTGGYNRVECIS